MLITRVLHVMSCYCYHKGTYFQANHNIGSPFHAQSYVVIATTKVRIFKQITTPPRSFTASLRCYCYHKGTYFQANHNYIGSTDDVNKVVIATTKVRIFKQITTSVVAILFYVLLLLLPQRYVFSSKSQPTRNFDKEFASCYCYHKGTYFQANHNYIVLLRTVSCVVIATTKVRIFKQITTMALKLRYQIGCYCYHKGTYFQANHNPAFEALLSRQVVIATTKVRIFKQITTALGYELTPLALLLLPQRYVFSSKSQRIGTSTYQAQCCYCYHKGTYFQANHNSLLQLLPHSELLLLPQRYVFSSKSQQAPRHGYVIGSCYCYHKGTYFQANHNAD